MSKKRTRVFSVDEAIDYVLNNIGEKLTFINKTYLDEYIVSHDGEIVSVECVCIDGNTLVVKETFPYYEYRPYLPHNKCIVKHGNYYHDLQYKNLYEKWDINDFREQELEKLLTL